MSDAPGLPPLGWLERVALPELGISMLTAKVDTGARTSALHAEELELTDAGGIHVARFVVPTRRGEYRCECPVADERHVKSSSGHEELRIVIETVCVVHGYRWPIELTLTDRAAMKYPMLLGRQATAGRFVIDPGAKYVRGRPFRKRRRR